MYKANSFCGWQVKLCDPIIAERTMPEYCWDYLTQRRYKNICYNITRAHVLCLFIA